MTKRRVSAVAFGILVVLLVGNIVLTFVNKDEILTLINKRHADALVREAESKEHQRNSAVNRALNVETWCEGRGNSASLNGIVRFNKAFVIKLSNGRLHYGLSPNDCFSIIETTLESGISAPTLSTTGTPLVYRALQTPANRKLYIKQLRAATR